MVLENKRETRDTIAFKDGPMPMYMYFTLIGQEYDTLLDDPSLFRSENAGDNTSYYDVISMLHAALMGNQKPCYGYAHRPTARAFDVDYLHTKTIRVKFISCDLFDDRGEIICTLVCHDDKEKSIKSYLFYVDYETLAWYGLVDNEEVC